jgi:hypothetical protein
MPDCSGRDGSQLFIHLILKLRHFADACVLWVLLKERADVKEVTTTSMLMSHVQLADLIDRNAAKRAFHSLQQLGLIRVRVHRKTATLVMVDRPAVLQLLAGALDDRLPGLSGKAFPFLDAWSAELSAEARASAIEKPDRERPGAAVLGTNPQPTSTASGQQADALSPPST